MAREAGGWGYIHDAGDEPYKWQFTPAELQAFEAIIRADERNRTWTQEHWTEYERSIAAAVREECAALADKLEWADHKGVASAIRARGNT
jgi:hypothetical protein